jgi:hypothetical protein
MNDQERRNAAELYQKHMARILEIRSLYDRRLAGQASLADLLTLASWETWEAIYSLPPWAPDSRPVDPDHASAAAFRAVSSLVLAEQRLASEADVCGKRCDHGSECLLLAGHTPSDKHETQHGCVFYDSATPSLREETK